MPNSFLFIGNAVFKTFIFPFAFHLTVNYKSSFFKFSKPLFFLLPKVHNYCSKKTAVTKTIVFPFNLPAPFACIFSGALT